jgi:S1-C subfamily serine protease
MHITGRFDNLQTNSVARAFRDGFGNPVDGSAAIFPIIQASDSHPWLPIGTGFFISKNGLFATAKHVVLDSAGHLLPDLAGIHLLRAKNAMIVRQAFKIVTHPRADVALGFLFDKHFAEEGVYTDNKLLRLTRDIPPIGSKVAAIAFPKTERVDSAQTYKILFKMAAMEGIMEQYHPDGRDTLMLPGRCFRTSMNILGGASGGPVVSGDGSVFGINSTGYESLPVSFISSVQDLFDLDVLEVRLPGRETQDRAKLQELIDLGLVVVR